MYTTTITKCKFVNNALKFQIFRRVSQYSFMFSAVSRLSISLEINAIVAMDVCCIRSVEIVLGSNNYRLTDSALLSWLPGED